MIGVVRIKGGDRVRVTDIAMPDMRPDNILVKVRKSAVNPIDIYLIDGTATGPGLSETDALGCEFVGTVEAVGASVTGVKLGDRVWGCNQCLRGEGGGWAEYATVKTGFYHLIPDTVADDDVAAIGLNGATAYLALRHVAEKLDGENVFIHGAGGNVGNLLVQIATLKGAICIGTTGSADALDECAGGSFVMLNYKSPTFEREIHQHARSWATAYIATSADPNFTLAFQVLKPRGKIIVLAGRTTQAILPVGDLYLNDRSIQGVALFNATTAELSDAAKFLMQALKSRQLGPRIRKTYPISEIVRAIADQRVPPSGRRGKVLIDLPT